MQRIQESISNKLTHENSSKRPASPSPSPSTSPNNSNAYKKHRHSGKPEIRYLRNPIKSGVDKNNYRLIQLPNDILALLISDRESTPVPSWQNRQCSTLGFAGYAPGPGSPFCPSSNGLQNLENVISPIKNDNLSYNSLVNEEFTPGKKLPQLVISGFADRQLDPDNPILGCGCSEHEESHQDHDQDPDSALTNRPNSDEAAFALNVHVGSSNDPRSHNGLAHFCEHMVHYGSKKYQQEDTFFKFALDKGKGANAFTQAMTTTYHFSVTTKNFEKGLDIFSNLIASPLFSLDCIQREVHAVDNEFMLSEHKDILRHYHILWQTVKYRHPLNSFPCGNRNTLLHPKDPNGAKKLQTALKNFHKEYYVGSGMTLAAQSSLSLDELEDLVVENFSQIPCGTRNIRRNRTVAQSLKSPYDTPEFRRMYTVKGNESKIRLIVSWPLSPEGWQDWKNKPVELIELLMNEEWHGGLSHSLRQKGWIVDWLAGCVPCEIYKNDYTTLFKIITDLTVKGMQNLPEIVESIYAYIKRIQEIPKNSKVQLWNQLAKTCNQHFEYSSAGNATNLTVYAARMLQIVPGEEIFQADACIDKEFNNEAFKMHLDALKPSRMNLMIFMPSKILANSKRKFDKMETYTKAQYYVTNFSPQFMKKLCDVKPFEGFESIPGNPFVPILTAVHDQGNIKKQDLCKNSRAFVSHQGHAASVFKAKLQLMFVSSVIKSNPRHGILLNIWGGCLRNAILTHASAMKRAGMEVSLQAAGDMLKFELIGFPEMLPKAMEIILFQALNSNQQISNETFRNVKQSISDLYKDCVGSVLFLVRGYEREIMTVDYPSLIENLSTLEDICYTDLLNFVELFKSSSYGIATLSGNISLKDGLTISAMMEDLDYSPDIGNWRTALRSPEKISLPPGERCLRIRSSNRNGVNTAILNCYQLAPYDDDVSVHEAVQFLGQYMQAPAFHILRTQGQLGYIVYCDSCTSYGYPVLKIHVVFQSTKFSACHVDQQIDAFLVNFYHQYLRNLTEGEFSEQKMMLNIQSDMKRMNIVSWYERTFLNAVTIKDDKVTWKDSCGNIAKLSIQVLGSDKENCKDYERCGSSQWEDLDEDDPRVFFARDKNSEDADDLYFIHDLKDFRDSRVR